MNLLKTCQCRFIELSRIIENRLLDTGGKFTTINVPFTGVTFTEALGINDRGQIVGIYFDASGEHGYLDSGGKFSTIDVPFAGVTRVEAFRINDGGQIVGNWVDASGITHGYLATPVPEPSSLLLLGLGLVGLTAWQWKRRGTALS